MKITVNGTTHETEAKTLSYDDICILEHGKVPVALMTIVHHTKGKDGWERNGFVTPGQSVEVLEGMRINLAHTGGA